MKEVIEACEAVTGRTIPVRYGSRRAGDPPALVASHDRATRELGWRLRFPNLRQMVETAWNWHRNHPHGHQQHAKG